MTDDDDDIEMQMKFWDIVEGDKWYIRHSRLVMILLFIGLPVAFWTALVLAARALLLAYVL